MNIVSNRNTSQAPMSTLGLTGKQVTKFIRADRIYVKAPDPQDAAPGYFTVSNGSTPAGWTDLGSLTETPIKINYQPTVKQVTTGPNQYLRAAYYSSQGAEATFSLAQFDDVILSTISGITPAQVAGGIAWNIGSTDMTQLALLIVEQDMLTGKEVQHYNPSAYVTFSFDQESDGARILGVTAILPFFTPVGSTSDTLLSMTFFAYGGSSTSTPPTSTTFAMNLASVQSLIIASNLGTTDVVPFVTDSSGNPIEYGDFRVIDANNNLISFAVPTNGIVTVKSFANDYAANFTTTASGGEYAVNVSHGLNNTSVGICVYSGGVVIQTGNVTIVDANNLTIQFAVPVTGRVIVYPT